MNLVDILIQTIGGLGLFILGMRMMTDGLQLSAGTRIKNTLGALSSNRVIGFTTGTVITALIQSSSATTVILIGFVSAGLLTLQQAVGVILGANVGTTVTSQLIAFKLSSAALPAISIGVAIKFFSKQKKYKYLGDIVLGFGLLFFGMSVMKQGLAPIKSDPSFISFFTMFEPGNTGGLLLCVATGAVLTIMVQSSSATVGLTMTLATQGLLSFPGAMALVLGENIGTTITAELATIGASNINAHRAARAHTMFNVIGVGIILIAFPYFVDLVEGITLWLGGGEVTQQVNGELVNVSRYIANGHTIFNMANAIIFLIFLPSLIRVAIKLSPKREDAADICRLPNFDSMFEDTPIAALAQVRSEIVRMAESAMLTLKNTVECIENRDCRQLSEWNRYEQHLDMMKKEITSYLITVYQGGVNENEAKEISNLMIMTNNLEKIGDSVENIAKRTEVVSANQVTLSDKAIANVVKISDQAIAFLHLVTQQIGSRTDTFMEQAEIMEDNIDSMRDEMRQAHIEDLRSGACAIEPGLIFIDMLANFEKIGDYCFNIAEALTGRK